MMGVRGRGGGVLSTFASLPEVEVRYVCDLDEQVLAVADRPGRAEDRASSRSAIKDFRKALDDKTLDALVLGTPDHWHALPTIHACQAGKDVYVEKPDGHNILEGRTMVAAAKKYGRVVQLGTQSRSGQHFLSVHGVPEDRRASARCASPRPGKAPSRARSATRPTAIRRRASTTTSGSAPRRCGRSTASASTATGGGSSTTAPATWATTACTGSTMPAGRWQRPLAAQRETLPDLPRAVSALGGKYYFDDAQEWPDTMMVTYDFAPGYLLTYEMRVWNAYPLHDESEGAAVCGDNGYVVIGNSRWRAFDAQGQARSRKKAAATTTTWPTPRIFSTACGRRGKPTADLETVGHPSSLLCHLGNAAWRSGRTLRFDPATYTFTGDADANQFLTRAEYRKPWLLPKLSERVTFSLLNFRVTGI